MTTTRIRNAPCPWCGDPQDAATGVTTAAAPKPGDWSLCNACGGVALFRRDLTKRRASAAELAAARPDTRDLLLRASAAIRERT
jgi:hypothetical protein